MNSNGGSGGNESDLPENIFGSSPGSSSLRSRTDSESSDKYVIFLLLVIENILNFIFCNILDYCVLFYQVWMEVHQK